MHKNTLLFVSLLAVIAALLIGFNLGRNMSGPPTSETTPSPKPSPTPTLTMLSGSACGITFQYPNNLQTMEGSTSGMVLANMTNPDESVVIVCQQEIPRIPLTPDKMEKMTIQAATGSASVSATLYHDNTEKNGAAVDKLIFTHPETGLDVFIAGFGTTFNQFITTLKLL